MIPFFRYPEDIRRVVYTTNAIESINYSIRKVTKKRCAFPTDDSVRKVVYLALSRAAEKWMMPIRDWAGALNYFEIVSLCRQLVVGRNGFVSLQTHTQENRAPSANAIADQHRRSIEQALPNRLRVRSPLR